MYLQSQMHGSFSNEPRQSGIPGAALWWSWISWRQTQSHCQTSGQYFSLHFMISNVNVNVLIPPSWWHCTRPPSGPQCGDHAAATTALHKLFAHSTNNMWGHPGECADWKLLKTFYNRFVRKFAWMHLENKNLLIFFLQNELLSINQEYKKMLKM